MGVVSTLGEWVSASDLIVAQVLKKIKKNNNKMPAGRLNAILTIWQSGEKTVGGLHLPQFFKIY